jgi:hypothetical protein
MRASRLAAGCLAGLAILLGAAAATAGGRREAGEPDVVFDWSFEKRTPAGGWVSVEVEDPVALADADQVRFGIRPAAAGSFVYLLVQESGGAIELLFPLDVATFTAPGYEGVTHVVPSATKAFELTGSPATERFTLIGSTERLRELEARIAAARKAGTAEIAPARQRIVDEVAALRRRYSTLTVVADKPVPIAGSMRSTELKSAGGSGALTGETWTRVEAIGFYIRTFRIAH